MITDWRDADLQQILELWNSFYPKRYHIDLDILRINTVDSPTFDWGASLIDLDFENMLRAFVVIKKAPAKFHKVADADAMHLSAMAFTDPLQMVDVFGESKRIMRQRGTSNVLFGMDSRHFWPGVPTDKPRLNDFLMVEGFTLSGEYFDLERDLSDYVPPKDLPTGDIDFRILTEEDHALLVRFLDREFPGRWRYDILTKLEKEESYRGIVGLFHNNAIHGFASIQDSSTKYPIGGAVWRNSLGENWGTLGPIGVSQKVRGNGWGGAMLAAGLLELQSRGVKQCLIDWTTLDEFYGKHGFEKTRTYRAGKLLI
jgi:GNAT superfamily N-acetyltransferase